MTVLLFIVAPAFITLASLNDRGTRSLAILTGTIVQILHTLA